MTETWFEKLYNVISKSLLELNLWTNFWNFIFSLFWAIIVFIIGWFLAEIIGKIVARFLKVLKLDKIFERTNWKEALEAAEIKTTISDFIGAILKWIFVIITLAVSVSILGPEEKFTALLNDLVKWLPNVVIAVAIFVVAIIIADILNRVIRASVKKIGVKYAEILGTIVRWAIYIFAFLAILSQLKVASAIIETLVMGFVGMIALALGLSFGLGGKDAAAKLIEDFKKKISEG